MIDAERLKSWLCGDGDRGSRAVMVATAGEVARTAYEGFAAPWIAQILPDYPPNPAPLSGHPGSDAAEENYRYVLQTEKDSADYVRAHPGALFVMLGTVRNPGFVMERVFGPIGEQVLLDLVRGLPWRPLGNLPPAIRAAAPPPPWSDPRSR